MIVHSRRYVMYLSRLAPGSSPTCIPAIIRTARVVNARESIRSILVFDGERFCQYLEGDGGTVAALCGRIYADRRHVEVVILDEGVVATAPTFCATRSLEYALSPDSTLEAFESLRGTDALALFARRLPQLDREP